MAYHKTAAALSPFSKTGLTDIEDVVPFIRHRQRWLVGNRPNHPDQRRLHHQISSTGHRCPAPARAQPRHAATLSVRKGAKEQQVNEMDRFNQYRIFVQVAEMGSFIRAAHALEVPRASVSAAVQQLETQLGVRLLHRTTRQVRLTADGEQLLERLRPLLAEWEDIDQSFQASQRRASGRLSVDVPSRIARRLIAPALPGLLRRHPHLQLVLGSADRAIDLVQEGVDCAVRVGDLHDSSP